MSTVTLIGLLGAKSLFLTYIWLASAVLSSYVSDRKGYGEKKGLATGMILSLFGAIIWLVYPAKEDSRWKLQGPWGSSGKTVAEARAERDAAPSR